jgi:hypothetical protein
MQKQRKQNAIEEIDEESAMAFDMDSIHMDSIQRNHPREVLTNVTFHAAGRTYQEEGKVDTGAMASCLPQRLLPSIGISQHGLKPCRAVLRGISGMDLDNQGTISPCHLQC